MALYNKLRRPPQARHQYSTDVVRQQNSATKPPKQTHTQMDLTAEERGADRDCRRRVIQGLCLPLCLFLQLTVIWAARVSTPVVERTKQLKESWFTYEFDMKIPQIVPFARAQHIVPWSFYFHNQYCCGDYL